MKNNIDTLIFSKKNIKLNECEFIYNIIITKIIIILNINYNFYKLNENVIFY